MLVWNRIQVQSYVKSEEIKLDDYSWFELVNKGTADLFIGFETRDKQLKLKPGEKQEFPLLQGGVYRGNIYVQFAKSGTTVLQLAAVRQNNVEIT